MGLLQSDRRSTGRKAEGEGQGDLTLSSLVRRFGPVTALGGVDLLVRRGELLTILGPSGSGKTTLLKAIAGFETPDAGSIHLAGRDITSMPPAKRGIGMVFQNYALFPHMTVAENIGFPLEMRRVPKGERQRRVDEALQLVDLAGYGARLPRQLSGGQQQRVALARAVVFRPSLLLLDEPFGALDRKLREQMQLEVKRLQRNLGLTALFVTHDQEEALILSDRIAVMNQGAVVQLGTPQEIYSRPVNRFVADFIGESNLFRVRWTGKRTAVMSCGAMIEVDGEPYQEGAEVGLIIRPERPRLIVNGGTADNCFAGTITETIYLGGSLKYGIRLDAGFEIVVRWNGSEPDASQRVGDRVVIGWDRCDMHAVAWS
jgi:putative spermidine/putrescine transport system ATP-binding protein